MQTFSTLPLSQAMLQTLSTLGFNTPTPIQACTIPAVLAGRDLLGEAQTGSGKTLAFGIPLLERIVPQQKAPSTLIIAPTRELCEQIANVLKTLALHIPNLKILTLYGGVPLRPQATSLAFGADIVVGTAGRLADHLFRQTLSLENIQTLILDEADRMLDMGFSEEIMKIIAQLPTKPQALLFSATYAQETEDLANAILKEPFEVRIKGEKIRIKEIAYEAMDKERALLAILQSYKPASVVVFCNMKVTVNTISDFLYDAGCDVATLHGDFDQKIRNEALLCFANKSLPILVATDVASRGLDVEDVEMVISFDVPHKSENYTHRKGRTGRAGKKGIAVTLFAPHEKKALQEVAPNAEIALLELLKPDRAFVLRGLFATLEIDGGKKEKLRKADIMGTLCKEVRLDAQMIGAIDIYERTSYVAVAHEVAEQALKGLQKATIKKRRYRARKI